MGQYIYKRCCAFCGDICRIPNPKSYAYKRRIYNRRRGHGFTTYYFCSWSCMQKCEHGEPLERWKMAAD